MDNTKSRILNARVTPKTMDDIEAYCKEAGIKKAELVELAVQLFVYGGKFFEEKKGELSQEIESLLNALGVQISLLDATGRSYLKNYMFLDELSIRLSQAVQEVEAIKEDAKG